MKPLLLYDTRSLDLTRDVKEFCGSVGVSLDLIPLTANAQTTLGAKEAQYINNCTAAVFLIT